jgi:hypothetical protein
MGFIEIQQNKHKNGFRRLYRRVSFPLVKSIERMWLVCVFIRMVLKRRDKEERDIQKKRGWDG